MYSFLKKRFHKRKRVTMRGSRDLEALYNMTDTYHEIALLDLKTGISHHVGGDPERSDDPDMSGGETSYDKWMERMSRELLHPDYSEEFHARFNVESLRQSVDRGDSRQTLVYKCRSQVGGDYHWMQAEYVAKSQKPVSDEIFYYIRDVNDWWITAEKERQELQKALERSERENRASLEFLENFSENLMVSVSSILNMNCNALRTMEKGQMELSQRYLSMSNSVAAYLLPLFTDLVELSHFQKKGVTLMYECFDIHHLTEMCHEYCHDLVRDKRISLMWSGDLHGYYLGDENLIQLVLVNILENAVKFNHSGGYVRLMAEILDGVGTTDIFLIRVTDNGIGISPEEKKCLFDPFHRGLHKASDLQHPVSFRQGPGIGLCVAKSILDAMGGNIRVESEPGAGTEVTIQFALQRAQGAAMLNPMQYKAAMGRR